MLKNHFNFKIMFIKNNNPKIQKLFGSCFFLKLDMGIHNRCTCACSTFMAELFLYIWSCINASYENHHLLFHRTLLYLDAIRHYT